jgi:hypothetical protein
MGKTIDIYVVFVWGCLSLLSCWNVWDEVIVICPEYFGCGPETQMDQIYIFR